MVRKKAKSRVGKEQKMAYNARIEKEVNAIERLVKTHIKLVYIFLIGPIYPLIFLLFYYGMVEAGLVLIGVYCLVLIFTIFWLYKKFLVKVVESRS